VSFLTSLLVTKQFELLHQLLPATQAVGVLVNPANPYAEAEPREVRQAAHALGREVDILNISTDREIDAAFISIAQKGIRGLQVVMHSSTRDANRSLDSLPATPDRRCTRNASSSMLVDS
jgi:ABC-type uncharacterized transport system substrate-binding protein